MSRQQELAKNTLILGIGTFGPKLINIIIIPLLTSKLTHEEYGNYDLILTIIMFLGPIVTMQIQSAAFRFLIDCRGDAYKAALIIRNTFTVVLSGGGIISFGILVCTQNLSIQLRIAIMQYFFWDIMYQVISQIVRGLNKNRIYTISSLILAVTNGAGIVISLGVMSWGLCGVLFSTCIANIIAFFYVAGKISIWKYWEGAVSKSIIKQMISYSWPMIPNNLSNWVLKLSDRIVITAVLGIEENAVYAAANKIPNFLAIAQSVLIMAWQESASKAVKDDDAEAYYSQMLDSIFSLMISVTALLIAFTPIMFKVLIRGDYEDAYFQMPILIFAMFFCCMSSFQGGIYIAHKRTQNVGISTVIAAVTNLVVDVALINSIGIYAASVSTLIAYMVLYVYRMVDIQRIQRINCKVWRQLMQLVIIVFMLMLCGMKSKTLNAINMILSMVLFFVLNKRRTQEMIKRLR